MTEEFLAQKVELHLSTVDGHLSAMLVCSDCEAVLMDTDINREETIEQLACQHTNQTSVWEYLGCPL